ncbi:MAG: hypothetical protein R6U36_06370 [Candidatus Fermentibacteraceae bacterium]
MRSYVRKLTLLLAATLAALALIEITLHNLKVGNAMRMEELDRRRDDLQRRIEDLEDDRARLLSPQRLREAASRLGLEPLPLERVGLVEVGPGEVTGGS